MEQGFEVSGCPSIKRADGGLPPSRFNGKYWPDKAKQGAGFSCAYRREGESHECSVIEKGPSNIWRITEGYNPPFYYFCQFDSDTPPVTGWTIGDAVCDTFATMQPPTLKKIQRCKKCFSTWPTHECYGVPKAKQGVGASATWA